MTTRQSPTELSQLPPGTTNDPTLTKQKIPFNFPTLPPLIAILFDPIGRIYNLIVVLAVVIAVLNWFSTIIIVSIVWVILNAWEWYQKKYVWKVIEGAAKRRNFNVAIIGCGAGGINAAIELKKRGIPFVIYEKSDQIGGTWDTNKYPGCACDVPSHYYSYSFDLNPDWSRVYSSASEIKKYFENVVKKNKLMEHIQFNTTIENAKWDELSTTWKLTTRPKNAKNAIVVSTNILISAVGGLHVPNIPNFPGKFDGISVHTAKYDPNIKLEGKNVAVIGNAASAIQLIPQIHKKCKNVYVFQRTPNWLTPKMDRPYSDTTKWIFRNIPMTMRLYRWYLFMGNEFLFLQLFGKDSSTNKNIRKSLGDYLKGQFGHDTPLIPDFEIGCKRILPSPHMEYYKALTEPNVHLIASPIVSLHKNGIIYKNNNNKHENNNNGNSNGNNKNNDNNNENNNNDNNNGNNNYFAPVDVLIYATGFKVGDCSCEFYGRNNVKFGYSTISSSYWGISVPNFPNYFCMTGPNTGLGHSSIIFMMECQTNYIVNCIQDMLLKKHLSVEIKQEVSEQWQNYITPIFKTRVWTGSCKSWYKINNNNKNDNTNGNGKNTNGNNGNSNGNHKNNNNNDGDENVFAIYPSYCIAYWWGTLVASFNFVKDYKIKK